jgi:hypothetical protein
MISVNREIMKNVTSSIFYATALSGALLVVPFQRAQAEPASADFDSSEACKFSVQNKGDQPLMMPPVIVKPGDNEPPAELWILGQTGNCPKNLRQKAEKRKNEPDDEQWLKIRKSGCNLSMWECRL